MRCRRARAATNTFLFFLTEYNYVRGVVREEQIDKCLFVRCGFGGGFGRALGVLTTEFIKQRMEAVQTDDTAVTVRDFLLLFF